MLWFSWRWSLNCIPPNCSLPETRVAVPPKRRKEDKIHKPLISLRKGEKTNENRNE
jgi:hypothetical protein